MKKILMIIGSLRKNSFNLQLAKKIAEMLEEKTQVSFLDYADIPFMNQDIEFPVPESVARVRQAVLEADGIWIVSAEYNFQIPGVLKNLLDWLSRPMAPGASRQSAATAGKIVTISGAAGRSGAAGVRKNLSALVQTMSMKPVAGMGTGVSLNAESFKSGKLNLSEENLAALQNQVDAFLTALVAE